MTEPYKVPKVFETAQEVIDYVAPLLYAQGKPSAARHLPGDDGDEALCLYRSKEGRKCFAGFLINDCDYDASMEDQNAVSDWVAPKLQVTPKLHSFVFQCQKVLHDKNSANKELWLAEFPKRLAEVCKPFNLRVPELAL